MFPPSCKINVVIKPNNTPLRDKEEQSIRPHSKSSILLSWLLFFLKNGRQDCPKSEILSLRLPAGRLRMTGLG
jgi:hypothetical protein